MLASCTLLSQNIAHETAGRNIDRRCEKTYSTDKIMTTDNEDEIVIEDEAEATPAALAKLREKLKKCVAEKQEYLDGWQRARADFANYKREESALTVSKEERIKAEFAEAMAPAVDAVWFAMQSPAFKEASAQWQAGLQTVADNLKKSLAQFGVSYIAQPPPETKVDFAKFEIIREVPTDDEAKDNTVETVHRVGLQIGDQIIRPAQVSVCAKK